MRNPLTKLRVLHVHVKLVGLLGDERSLIIPIAIPQDKLTPDTMLAAVNALIETQFPALEYKEVTAEEIIVDTQQVTWLYEGLVVTH